MNTLIVRTTLKLIVPLFLVFSIYLLFRGHNQPGGGFIGGLIAAIPIVFHVMVFGVEKTKQIFKLNIFQLIGFGLLISASSGLISMFFGDAFMTSLWGDFEIPFLGKPGTPIMFDIGVYLLVVGIVLRIAFAMSEED
jgi:multicomponent Na+:H+ antiporter subunit B